MNKKYYILILFLALVCTLLINGEKSIAEKFPKFNKYIYNDDIVDFKRYDLLEDIVNICNIHINLLNKQKLEGGTLELICKLNERKVKKYICKQYEKYDCLCDAGIWMLDIISGSYSRLCVSFKDENISVFCSNQEELKATFLDIRNYIISQFVKERNNSDDLDEKVHAVMLMMISEIGKEHFNDCFYKAFSGNRKALDMIIKNYGNDYKNALYLSIILEKNKRLRFAKGEYRCNTLDYGTEEEEIEKMRDYFMNIYAMNGGDKFDFSKFRNKYPVWGIFVRH